MSDSGEQIQLAGVRFERLLPGPAEHIWEFLTDASHLPGWFGDGSIEPRVGGAVTLMGGHVRGTVTRWMPPTELVYTWNVYDPGGGPSNYPESYVRFDLEPREAEVLLRLTHFPVLDRFEKQNAMGWHTYLDMLTAAARREPVEDRSHYMERNAALYGVDLNDLLR